MKRFVSLLLSLLMVLSLVACGGTKTPTSSGASAGSGTAASSGGTSAGTTTPTEPEKPAEPKILNMAVDPGASNASGLIAQLNTDIAITQLTVATLYMTLPDGKGGAGLVPALAASEPVDVNGDGLTWNIKIHPDAKFENGEKIDADVMLYTLKMALDPKLLLTNAGVVGKNYVTILNAFEYYSQISNGVTVNWEDVGIKKVDDMTIQITLADAANSTLVMRQFSARQTAPIYQPVFEKCLGTDGATTTYGTSVDKWIGSGPFTMTNWVQGAVREFVKNENFIRADLVKLDGIKQVEVEEAGTQQQLFESDQIDYLNMDVAALDKYGDDPRIQNFPEKTVYEISFCTNNTEKPIISNENFRLALYYGTDREAVAEVTAALPGSGTVNWHSTAYADGTKYRTIADAAGYMPANNGYDPEKAKAYFEKALQETNMSSVEVSILVSASSANNLTICEFLQESWNKLFDGKLTLTIDAQPAANVTAQRKTLHTGNNNAYELTLGGWGLAAGSYDPISAMKVYTTTYSSRLASYADYPELTAIYNEANEKYLLDPVKRAELCMEMEKYIIDHAVVVPLTYKTGYTMIADRVVLAMDGYDLDIGWGWMYADIAQ